MPPRKHTRKSAERTFDQANFGIESHQGAQKNAKKCKKDANFLRNAKKIVKENILEKVLKELSMRPISG